MHASNIRIRALGFVILAALFVLLARLWWLQLTNWSDYTRDAWRNRTKVVYQSAPRGLIYDRRGEHILAANRDVWGLCVVPADLPEDEPTLEKEVAFLASTLTTEDEAVSTRDVREELQLARGAKAVDPVPLQELGQDLTFDQVAAIEERLLELPGIAVATTTRRYYPYGKLAAHTIGYARSITAGTLREYEDYTYPPDPRDPTRGEAGASAPEPMYRPDSIVGEKGVEAMCEMDEEGDVIVPVLPGRRGRTVHEIDATLMPQRLLARREPAMGASVYVTLDARVQYVAERALRAALAGYPERTGAVVVMDTGNGDVIALASEPCVNPNDWALGFPQAMWRQMEDTPGHLQLNKATSPYPPGSIFKAVSMCAILETTNVSENTTVECQGAIHVGAEHRRFKCWTTHGQVALISAIARSCNIWFYNTVLKFGLDPNDISTYAHRFGLGEPTGVGIGDEKGGVVPEPKYSEGGWRTGHSLHYVIGQELTVTPLQMCVVCAAIANNGRLLTPNLIRRIRWPSHVRRPDISNKTGKSRKLRVDQRTLGLVRLGMRRAITMEHGTASGLKDLQVAGAGKTGTAQDPPLEDHSWFIGFAPYEPKAGERQYAVCAFVARGETGSKTAVPIAKEVLRALFGLHEADDPAFKLPPPLTPEQVARRHQARVAAAERWAKSQQAAEDAAEATARQENADDDVTGQTQPQQ